jgi:hypothetical protein
MSKSQIDWDLIDTYAERQGVSYWARRKWRQRNHVPWKWRIALAWRSDGRISLDWFQSMDKQNRRKAA